MSRHAWHLVWVLGLCIFCATAEEPAKAPITLDTWTGYLKQKPAGAAKNAIALFIPDAKAGEKDAPKEVVLLAPDKVSPEALAKHAEDKIKAHLKVEVKGVRTAEGIVAYEMKPSVPGLNDKQPYVGTVKPAPKDAKNDLAMGLFAIEAGPGKDWKAEQPVLLVARSAKEKQLYAPYIKSAMEKGQRLEVTGTLRGKTLEVETLSVITKVEKLTGDK